MIEIRVGLGYDVHALIENRKLILGGVDVPYSQGLLGHSDADVLLHAIMDAMLGALALGDIGKHFPDTDERYRGISSLELLKHVNRLLGKKGYKVYNLDSTVVAERPKLAPYIESMRQTIGDALETDMEFISVKATTTEKLGFTGRGEGISAYAIVSLQPIVGLAE